MKAMKWLIGIAVVSAAVFVGGGMLLSPSFTVARTVLIAAPPDRIFGLIEDPRAWKRWAVWNRRDPQMRLDYAGPQTGNGAQWSWRSDSEGSGAMTFMRVVPERRVGYELFFADFGTTSTGALELEPQGASTRVTWHLNGDMGASPFMRWMGLFADRMMGKDFEAGLANLKTLAEQ